MGFSMWVKRTEPEIRKEARRQQRKRLLGEVCLGLVFMLVVTFCRGWREAGDHNGFLVPLSEVPARLPFGIFAGVILALTARLVSRGRSIVVCPKCQATKTKDNDQECSCGGKFEDLNTLKWIP